MMEEILMDDKFPWSQFTFERVHQHDAIYDPVGCSGPREVTLHQTGVFRLVDVLRDLRYHFVKESFAINIINFIEDNG